tara:strand:- start:3414 stop:3692 length:279 start_codon:yes stop_codon:yes gene_type:complete
MSRKQNVNIGDNLQVRCYQIGEDGQEIEKKKHEIDINKLFSNTYFLVFFIILSIALIIFGVYIFKALTNKKWFGGTTNAAVISGGFLKKGRR